MDKFKNYIPKALRYRTYRNKLNLPITVPKELTFKLASTKEEFMTALAIVHECYLEKGYAKDNSFNIRLTPYHLLPTTIVLLAIWENEVIGTMTLICESTLRLPMEDAFDLSELKKFNSKLCEISALAIKKKFRGISGEVFFPFTRYMWNFAYHFLDVDYFVIAVNPSMSELYEAIYLFEPLPKKSDVDNYNFANNNPAVGQFINIKTSFERFAKQYKNAKLEKNFYNFMINPNAFTDKFPKQEFYLQDFSTVKTEWLKELLPIILDNPLKHESVDKIVRAYGYFSKLQMEKKPASNRYRVPVSFNVENYQNTKIINFSKNGICIKTIEDFNFNERSVVNCKIGPNKLANLIVEKVWESDDGTMGLKILESSESWQKMIEEVIIDNKFKKIDAA